MLAGTTGLEGSARGRMTLLAAVIGLVLGYMAASVLDGVTMLGAVFSALAAGGTCVVISGIVAGATRRGGTAALILIVTVVALLVLAVSVVFPYLALLPTAGLAWLGVTRRRKAARKHAGLRVLR